MTVLINPYAFGTSGGGSSPSSVFIYKTALTDTTNKTSGQTYSWAGQDIGTAHTNRIVIAGVFSPAGGLTFDLTIGGVTATPPISGTVFNICSAAVPTGTTADFVVTCNDAYSRFVIMYGIYYPSSATPLGSGQASANGTTDATASVTAAKQATNGLLIAAGGQEATVGSFTWSWSGADSLTEHVDTTIESASSYSMVSLQFTTVGTQTLTMAESVSGTKKFAYATWGAAA